MRRLLFSLLILWAFGLQAQYVQIGNAQYGNVYRFGPMAAESSSAAYYSRFAYIYTDATLGRLQHGDSIRSLSFYREGFDSLRGTVNFKIYIGTTNQSDFGTGAISWKDETQVRIGIEKVYDGDPKSATGDQPGWVRFDFNVKDYFRYDTSNGMKNLEILVEYSQNTNPANDITWRYDTDFSFPAYQSNNETKYIFGNLGLQDSLINSSIAKPAIRLHIPKYDREAEVNMLYALGRVPLLMDRPDSIKTFVQNTGRKTIARLPVYLEVKGVNAYKDTLQIDSLRPYEQRLVSFAAYRPQRLGRDSLLINLPSDGIDANNRVFAIQDVTYNVFSHADPVTPNAGGIGFNGSSGDFVAKFYTDSAKYLNQVKVDFALGGRSFQIGIWEEGAGGMPGKNVYTSDTLQSTQGTYILRVDPKVLVKGAFFVGLRQTGTTNIAFAFQEESPVRPNTFYFAAPIGDTAWVSFSPGFDFKFNIQPRLEVAHDIGVLRIENPLEDQVFVYNLNDSIGVDALFYNYGSEDQDTAFDVICEIKSEFGQTVYRSSRRITLDSEDSLRVHFDTAFSLNNKGRFQAIVSSDLNKDQVPDNDELRSWFSVEIPADLSITRYFVPSFNSEYELNLDTIRPTVRIQNNGSSALRNFKVWFELRDTLTNSLLLSDSVQLTLLDPDDSEILSFSPYFCNQLGRFRTLTRVKIAGDIFPSNDSLYSEFSVIKSNDVGLDTILTPSDGSVMGTNLVINPYVQFVNEGTIDQDSVHVKAFIYKNDTLDWADSAWTDVARKSFKQHLFKKFRTSGRVEDTYRMMVLSQFDSDQDPSNDTLLSAFGLTESVDLAISKMLRPGSRIAFNSPDSTFRFTVTNQGYLNFNAKADLITELFYEDQLHWRDSFSFSPNIPAGESRDYGTTRSFRPDQQGMYKGRTMVLVNGDEKPSNDTFFYTFYVSADYDIELSSVSINQAELNCGDTLISEAIITNIGLNTKASDSGEVMVEIWRENALVGDYKLPLNDSLSPGNQLRLKLPNFQSCDTGLYLLKVALLLNDDNTENQFKEIPFRMDKPFELRADSILVPIAGSRFQTGSAEELIPRMRCTQQGSAGMNGVLMAFILKSGGLEVMTDSLRSDFAPFEQKDVAFNKAIPLEQDGVFELICYVFDVRDPIHANDSLRLSFEVADLSSIEDQQAFKVLLWPNPGRTELNLGRSRSLKNWQVRVIDPSGRLILNTTWMKGASALRLDISGQSASGLYFIEIISEDGRSRKLKWIRN